MVKKKESALNLFKGTRQEISLRKLSVKKKKSRIISLSTHVAIGKLEDVSL